MKSLDSFLYVVEQSLLIVLFAVLPILCFLQIICRFVFFYPVPWSEEAMRVLFIWATFIGCSLGVRRGSHLAVTAAVNMLPAAARAVLAVVIYVLCSLFCIYFAYNGLDVVLMAIEVDERMPVTGLPAYFSTAAIPLGFTMMAVRFLILAIERKRAPGEPASAASAA